MKAFVAGSTGAVGRTVVRIGRERGVDLVPHARPTSATREGTVDPQAVVFSLADVDALAAAMQGCTTVFQLIGTRRSRFAAGESYASSDVGTTRSLVEAAKTAKVGHFVLLSSVGAGRPVGPYLQAKAEAEALVLSSGIPYTIVRPSAFSGEGHWVPPGLGVLTRALRLHSYRPVTVEQLAEGLLRVAVDGRPLGILEGKSLWDHLDRSSTG